MMIANQYGPRILRFMMANRLAPAAIHNLGARFGLAEHIGPGIHGILKHMINRVVNRKLPDDLVTGTFSLCWQRYLFSAEPKQDLAGTAQLRHLGKDQMNSLLDPMVWIHLNLAVFAPYEADRKMEL